MRVGREIRGGAAVAAGRRHVAAGEACQDVAGLRRGRQVVVAAVADGCGSVAHGKLGAEAVVRAAMDLLINRFPMLLSAPSAEEACSLILSKALGAIRVAASREGAPVGSLATTLSFAALSGQDLLVCQMGDSPIVLQKADGHCEVAFPPKAGMALNETHFITSSTALRHMMIAHLPAADYRGAMVMSDGLAESLILRRDNSPAAVCQTILQTIKSLHRVHTDRWLSNELAHGPLRDRTLDDLGLSLIAWG